jgi:ketosteroid isomerase-like protein
MTVMLKSNWPCALVMICATLALAAPGQAAEPDVVRSAEAFLTAYAQGDKSAVMAMVDPDIHVYGSDIAEVFAGKAGFEHMFDGDKQLWQGTAHFGEIKNLSAWRQGPVASVFFDIPFSAGGRPEVMVRVSTVWRLSNGGWLLVQSSNVVPTVGQSADIILRRTRQ